MEGRSTPNLSLRARAAAVLKLVLCLDLTLDSLNHLAGSQRLSYTAYSEQMLGVRRQRAKKRFWQR